MVLKPVCGLTVREEHNQIRVFENKVLRTIVERTREEVRGQWRGLVGYRASYLCTLPGIIKATK
jgi:hypothetical protein